MPPLQPTITTIKEYGKIHAEFIVTKLKQVPGLQKVNYTLEDLGNQGLAIYFNIPDPASEIVSQSVYFNIWVENGFSDVNKMRNEMDKFYERWLIR